jgi:hypothetical protein
MNVSVRWIEAFKAHQGPMSDYRVAQHLGVESAHICNWRAGRSGMSDESAIALANIMGVEPGIILSELYAERAEKQHKTPVKKAWLRVAELLRQNDKLAHA